jgi:hypothetical protein
MKSITKASLIAAVALAFLTTALAFTLSASANRDRERSNRSRNDEPTGTAALTDTQKENIAGYSELLHENLSDQKGPILGVVLQLTEEEAAKFWPIYDQYNAEMSKINASAAANVDAYVKNFAQLSGQQADEIVRKSVDYHNQREALLAKYYGLVKASLGAATAARFFEIENQILLLIELQMNSNLPIGEQIS